MHSGRRLRREGGTGTRHQRDVVPKWRRQAGTSSEVTAGPTFIPVSLPPSVGAPAADIRIELRRGATTVAVIWPAGAECVAWLRELLK